ncbi:conserved hypothetical protein [Theileria equi strain WA]|uniref:EngB-type G domain-containing protein n=1 Tax=Theileria equi strain WA TaxID=1537102 RepID=L1LAM2_THEEQ|nr:conserved hypothetical protein [Theileria equi strain WA]EKX72325.1 conserved hypothetical protein [Theileria equi strain WA]|eukprot:XP_004831777.1 conserved hypothetical protein [Theileria equi strain WA]
MLLYSKVLLNALESAGKTAKIRFSEDTLKEVITKTLGKPTSSDEIRYFKSTRRTRALAPCIFGHLRPKVKLVASALEASELPKSTLPEIAFYGRSNVGKSLLINAVLGKHGFCDVKDLPGTTRKLFFYKVCSPGRVMLVDMPGYGYSVCSEDVSILYNEFSLWYIKNRENLKLLVLLIDGRVGLKRSDFEVINFCDKYKVRWLPVISKCDAVKPVLLAKMIQKVRFDTQQFRFMLTHAIPVSGMKMQNLDELRNILGEFKAIPTIEKPPLEPKKDAKEPKTKTSKKLLYNYLPEEKRLPLAYIPENATSSPTQPVSQSAPIKAAESKDAVKATGTGSHSLKDIILGSLDDIYAKMGFKDELLASTCTDSEEAVDDSLVPSNFTPEASFGAGYKINKGYIEIANYSYKSLELDKKNSENALVTKSTQDGLENGSQLIDGDIQFELSVNIGDTLEYVATDDENAPQKSNLVAEKIASFERKLSSGLLKFSKIGRPQFKRSYKRVFSMFKPKNAKKYMYITKTNEKVDNWRKIYNKWSKWSRRHPDLARYVYLAAGSI